MTFEGPKIYATSFTIKLPHELLSDSDIIEMFCDNEKDGVRALNPFQGAGRGRATASEGMPSDLAAP